MLKKDREDEAKDRPSEVLIDHPGAARKVERSVFKETHRHTHSKLI